MAIITAILSESSSSGADSPCHSFQNRNIGNISSRGSTSSRLALCDATGSLTVHPPSSATIRSNSRTGTGVSGTVSTDTSSGYLEESESPLGVRTILIDLIRRSSLVEDSSENSQMVATIRFSGPGIRKMRIFCVMLFEIFTLAVCVTGAALETDLGLGYGLRLFTSVSAAVQGAVFCFLVVVHFLTEDGRWLFFYGIISILRIILVTALCVIWICASSSRQSFLVGVTVAYLMATCFMALTFLFAAYPKDRLPSLDSSSSGRSSTSSTSNLSPSTRSALDALENSIVQAFPPPPKYEEIIRDRVPSYGETVENSRGTRNGSEGSDSVNVRF